MDVEPTLRRRPGLNDEIVLSIVRQSNGPIGAYRVAERSEQLDTRVEPAAVYRSLSRLIHVGNVERVESLNAYVASQSEPTIHIVCCNCGTYLARSAKEVDVAARMHGERSGFEVRISHFEVVGACNECSPSEAQDAHE